MTSSASMPQPAEVFVSVDIETAGPTPREHGILSIGACLVHDPETGFYVELQPEFDAVDPRAVRVSGLDPDALARDGEPAATAIRRFADWVGSVVPDGARAVFVAFNAGFDWMFLADAFERHLGANPFGHAALDVKAFQMGLSGGTWAGTSMRHLSPRYLGGRHLTHNALADARDQAELFRALLDEARARSTGDADGR